MKISLKIRHKKSGVEESPKLKNLKTFEYVENSPSCVKSKKKKNQICNSFM